MLRALTLVFLLALAAPAAAAPPLRLIDRGPAEGTLETDGVRRLAWSTYVTPPYGGPPPQGSAEIYDVVTGQRTHVQTRPYCYFADITTTELLWTCASPTGEAAVIDDFATGTQTVLKPPPNLGGELANYRGLGRHWFRVWQNAQKTGFEFFLNRTTGQVVRPSTRDRGVVYDVETSGLTRRLCGGMWRPLVPASYIGIEPGPLAIAGRTAAATTHRDTPDGLDGKVVLQRCGKPARTLQRCPQPTYCTQPVIDDRIVAWRRVRGQDSTLYLRSLRTGLTRSLRASLGQLTLLTHRLFATGSRGRLVEVAY